MKSISKLLLVTTFSSLISGCGYTEETKEAVSKVMKSGLVADFKKFQFEVDSYSADPTPSLLYAGKLSAILAAEDPEAKCRMGECHLVMRALARTANGRYFTLAYVSQIKQDDSLFSRGPCVNANCRYITDEKPLTEGEAKSWLFHSAAFTPERYKEIFKEKPPPLRVSA